MSSFKFLVLAIFSLLAVDLEALPRTGKYFDRAIFVIFENTNYADAVKQPFFKQLANTGALFTNMNAVLHPSQGNYIALTSGDTNGIINDNPKDIDVKNIIDLLEAKGLTWRVYAEDYPGNCFTGKASGNYVRKHNPFISFKDIQSNKTRCLNIVNASSFASDAQAGNLPNYVFYVPNLKNDAHDTNISYADKWYSQNFSSIVNDSRIMANTILITTFDESGSSQRNQIYTSIVGPNVRVGAYNDNVSIPSLLKLMEENWDLGNLGKKDQLANSIPAIWN